MFMYLIWKARMMLEFSWWKLMKVNKMQHFNSNFKLHWLLCSTTWQCWQLDRQFSHLDRFWQQLNCEFFVTICGSVQKLSERLQCTPIPSWPCKLNTWIFTVVLYIVSQIFLGFQNEFWGHEPDHISKSLYSSIQPLSNISFFLVESLKLKYNVWRSTIS